MIKKIIFLFIIVFTAGNLFANVYAEGNAGVTQLGVLSLNTSYGWGLYVDLNDNILFGYSGSMGSFSDKEYDSSNNVTRERNNNYFSNMGKIVYLYPISNFQLYVGGSAGVGVVDLHYRDKNTTTGNEVKKDESCPIGGLWLEGKYDFNQHISIVSRLGYQYALTRGDFAENDDVIHGVDFKIGISLSLFNNKRLY